MKPVFHLTDHIVKIAGAAVGFIAMGVFGLLFGLIGGALIDQLALSLRKKKRLRRFLLSPGTQKSASGKSIPQGWTESAGMAVLWYLFGKEAELLGLSPGLFRDYFPGLPGSCIEILSETFDVDYIGTADFFGRNADPEQKKMLNTLIRIYGLEVKAKKASTENPDGKTAKILTAAGISLNAYGSGVDKRDADLQLLGLPAEASAEEIKRVYRKLAADFHPDGGRSLSPGQQKITEDAFKLIQAAYERLTRQNPE